MEPQAQPSRPAGPPPGAGVPLAARAGGLVTHRVDEFLAPELDPTLAPPESVVHLPLGRVIGSTLLGGSTIWAIVLVAIIVAGVTSGQLWVLFSFVPAAIGLVSYMWSRITKSLRYSIAGTPDGVRIGYGLLSTGNETIPPGRIHAIEATQWVFWRPFGWWSIRINVAGQSVSASNEAAQRTLVLPVGTAADVHRVLELLLPEAAAEVEAFVDVGPHRSGRRRRLLEHAEAGGLAPPVLVAPHRLGCGGRRRADPSRRARAQPHARAARAHAVRRRVGQGPLDRALDLAGSPPAHGRRPGQRGAPASSTAARPMRLFERLADEAVERAANDTTHRWARRRASDGAPAIGERPQPRSRPRRAPATSTEDQPMSAERAGGSASASSAPDGWAPCSARPWRAQVTRSSASPRSRDASRERADAMLPAVPVLDDPRAGRAQRTRDARRARARARDRSSPGSPTRARGSRASSCCTRRPRFGTGVLAPARRSRRDSARRAPGDGRSPARASTSRGCAAPGSRSPRPAPVLPIGQALVVEMGGEPFVVAEDDRAAYAEAIEHGRLVLDRDRRPGQRLLGGIGVGRPGAVLAPLVRSAVENALSRHDSGPRFDGTGTIDGAGTDRPLGGGA